MALEATTKDICSPSFNIITYSIACAVIYCAIRLSKRHFISLWLQGEYCGMDYIAGTAYAMDILNFNMQTSQQPCLPQGFFLVFQVRLPEAQVLQCLAQNSCKLHKRQICHRTKIKLHQWNILV